LEKILFLTVGGRPDPLVTAIETLKPDIVVFVCSQKTESSKEASRDKLPCILEETKRRGLVFSWEEEVIDVLPDDFDDCVEKIHRKLQEIKERYPSGKICADFTGGTKTMGSALVWVAVEENLDLYLTTGKRMDLNKVVPGTQKTRRIPIYKVQLRHIERMVESYLNSFDFRAAERTITEALGEYAFPIDEREKLEKWANILSAFRLWDEYHSLKAYELLSAYKEIPEVRRYIFDWEEVIVDRARLSTDFMEKLKNSKPSIPYDRRMPKYMIVWDLILNGERCARRERFDEATARLYRALEAFAQLRLKIEYDIDTGNVELDKTHEILRVEYEKMRDSRGKIRIGLKEAYRLLLAKGDIVGQKFEHRKQLSEVLERRNKSVLAHGFDSITKEEYEAMKEEVWCFLKDCMQALLGGNLKIPSQLPDSIAKIEPIANGIGGSR